MNLIGNDCVSACFYAISKQQFNNPFTWTICNFPNMFYLIQNYNKINWKHYELMPSTCVPDTFKIVVDNKINIHYVHYKKNVISESEYRIAGDVFSKNIELKVVETYTKRVYRQLEQQETPVFILNTYADKRHQYTKENIIKLCNTPLKYKVIIITPYKELLSYKNENIFFILDESNDGQLVRCNKNFEQIKDILENKLNLKC